MPRFTKRFLITVWLLSVLIISPAQAHFPWLAVLDPDPLRFEIGWGHSFPRDGILAVERIASARLHLPDGGVRELVLNPGDEHSAGSLPEPGLYLLALRQRPGFYSQTADGGRSGSRLDFPEALSCSESANSMKALFSTGGTGGDPALVVGHLLEILPLVDPTDLKVGDELPVRILFRGAPYAGTLEATWDGYPDKDDHALSLSTDETGLARLPLSDAGLWLVIVRVQEPHVDKTVCDYQTYTATLTFRLGAAVAD